jgi:hypothetical protein
MHTKFLPEDSKEENCIKLVLKRSKKSGSVKDSCCAGRTSIPDLCENCNEVLDPYKDRFLFLNSRKEGYKICFIINLTSRRKSSK